jgi:pyruvate/2-oxoglutarate dehydrogenase complex dihydrolipoamide dehydrogenase (E3) component
VSKLEPTREGINLHLSKGTVAATHLFIATGRKPNTDDLGLETIGLKPSPGGFIAVNERLATPVQGIWAIGDIRGGPLFTHTSWDDYRILDSQLLGDGARTTRRIVPYAMFTDPELGRVGLTETEARESGRKFVVSRFDFSANGKAIETGEMRGFIKLVADAERDELLGAAVLGSAGAELVQLYVTLMNAGARYTAMRDAIYIHPTLAEAAQSAVAGLPDGQKKSKSRVA